MATPAPAPTQKTPIATAVEVNTPGHIRSRSASDERRRRMSAQAGWQWESTFASPTSPQATQLPRPPSTSPIAALGLSPTATRADRAPRPHLGSLAIDMANMRPEIIRALSADTMPAPTPGIGLDPARTDFFVAASRNHTSPLPLKQLAAVVVGRVVLAMSLGGISAGFVPKPPVAPNLMPHHTGDTDTLTGADPGINPHILAASAGGIAFGALLTVWGLGAFARDTWQLNPRRAAFMATLSAIGVAGVAGGGLVYILGQDRDSYSTRWLASIPRTLGNFCVFYALPNAFATSELVHGQAPIPNREQTRQLTFALGGAMMMFWAHISSPGLNAPLWAREIAQSLALVGLCVGAALARADTVRLQAEGRATAIRRASAANAVAAAQNYENIPLRHFSSSTPGV